jgi:hypothetical protein
MRNSAYWTYSLGNGAERPKFNKGEGGSESEIEIDGNLWRMHTYTTSGTFTVQRGLFQFSVHAVGGGSRGAIGDYSSYGGGGGSHFSQDGILLPTGDVPIIVGGQNGKTKIGNNGEYLEAMGSRNGNGVAGTPGGGSGAGNGGQGANGAKVQWGGGESWYSGGGSSRNWNYCCDDCCFGGRRNDSGGGSGRDCGGLQNAHKYGGGGGRTQGCDAGSGRGGLLRIMYQIDGEPPSG